MRLMLYLKGFATYIPGVSALSIRERTSTGSYPRYCYAIWLRHLHMLHCNGCDTRPTVLAELGPGASIGVGLAALITGTERYYGWDVKAHANLDASLVMFDELVSLFRRRAAIPGQDEFAQIKPHLQALDFPSDILTDERLAETMREDRLETLRDAIKAVTNGAVTRDGVIRYVAPWYAAAELEQASVDLVLAHVVMQSIEGAALNTTYHLLRDALKPGGLLSQQIDYRSHGIGRAWNEHWTIPTRSWRLMRGNRPYFWNRKTHSEHLRILRDSGFTPLHVVTTQLTDGIRREAMVEPFRHMSYEDSITSGAYILARKAT